MRRARVILAAVAAFAFVAGACSGGGDDSSDGDRSKPAAGEVFLEAVTEVGPLPFTDSVALAPVPAAAKSDDDGASRQGLRTLRGTTPGLYGAAGALSPCDATAAVAALSKNDEKAQAWVGALNDDPDLEWSGGSKLAVEDINTYVGELTPVFLRNDTRVTNHGFRRDAALAFQSVLQAGSAVMVDTRGMPRARCASFGPLIPPRPASSPKYRGVAWEGFDKTKLVTVTAGASLTTFRVVDVHTKEMIEIASGSGCLCDRTTASSTTTTVFEDEDAATTTTGGRTTTTQRRTTTTARPATTTTVPSPTTVATTIPPTTTTAAAAPPP